MVLVKFCLFNQQEPSLEGFSVKMRCFLNKFCFYHGFFSSLALDKICYRINLLHAQLKGYTRYTTPYSHAIMREYLKAREYYTLGLYLRTDTYVPSFGFFYFWLISRLIFIITISLKKSCKLFSVVSCVILVNFKQNYTAWPTHLTAEFMINSFLYF